MSKRLLTSRLFWRPPEVTSFWQWLAWRWRRNWGKAMAHVRVRVRLWRHAVFHTARSTVIADVTLTVQPSLSDPVTQQIVRQGVWEPTETAIMRRIIRPGTTVLDIGANLGHHTVLASRLVGPSGRVVAFEPEPRNLALLRKNIARNACRNVEVHPTAVSDQSGASITLYLAADNLGDHRIFASKDEEDREQVTVMTTTMDEVVGDTPVHFIKMDIQGAEGHAFAGMERTVRRNDDLAILFEFWPYGLRRASTEPPSVLKRLAAQGFSFLLVMDTPDPQGLFIVSATAGEILDRVAGERFEQSLNILASRGGIALDDLRVGSPGNDVVPN